MSFCPQGVIIFHDAFDDDHEGGGAQIRVEGVYIWPFRQLRMVANSGKDSEFSPEEDYLLSNPYHLLGVFSSQVFQDSPRDKIWRRKKSQVQNIEKHCNIEIAAQVSRIASLQNGGWVVGLGIISSGMVVLWRLGGFRWGRGWVRGVLAAVRACKGGFRDVGWGGVKVVTGGWVVVLVVSQWFWVTKRINVARPLIFCFLLVDGDHDQYHLEGLMESPSADEDGDCFSPLLLNGTSVNIEVYYNKAVNYTLMVTFVSLLNLDFHDFMLALYR
ncbi:Transmembrane E3 ubiquitin-protein ligase FLY2 [Bienertia sinuspersici]